MWVGFGVKTEIGPRNPDFRSSLNSRHSSTRRSRPKSANNGLMQRSKQHRLFDHVIGATEQRWRHVQTESPRGLEIDREIELGRLLDR